MPAPMAPLDGLDLYALKRRFEQANEWIDAAGALRDLRFLSHARRALLPLPLLDRRDEGPIDGDAVFPPFDSRPAPELAGKRVAVVGSGGGGACVAVVGVARALALGRDHRRAQVDDRDSADGAILAQELDGHALREASNEPPVSRGGVVEDARDGADCLAGDDLDVPEVILNPALMAACTTLISCGTASPMPPIATVG